MSASVYLDHNATTPVDPSVLEVMLPYFSHDFGNAASHTHAWGLKASRAVEKAREQVAALVGAEPQEIVFTSGATEAINLAIKGVCEIYAQKGRHIVTLQTEHKAVLDCCAYLEKTGAEVTYLPVGRDGLPDLAQLERAIRPDTVLVAVMRANNETGVLQPVDAIARIVHEKKSLFLCDATQAAGKIRVDVNEDGADLLCLSAHKFYGPKGTGALYVRRRNPRVSLAPLIHGGGHERGLRSGTLNVPGIVGMGAAAVLAAENAWTIGEHLSKLRTWLEQHLLDLGGVYINGSTRHRLPNTSNLCFTGVRADQLITRLPQLALSAGSACTSALREPSHVLLAMGIPQADIHASLRFSLGKDNTEEQMKEVLAAVVAAVNHLRAQA